MKLSNSILLLTLGTLLLVNLALADGKEEFPTSGNLATTFAVPTSRGSFSGPLANTKGKDISFDESPISGSVSKVTPTKWAANVSNTSKDSFSVRVEVVQYDAGHSRIKSDYFSYTLAPGQSKSADVSVTGRMASCELNLLSVKKLGGGEKATATKK